MRSVCEDLGMKFVGIHSAKMHDLTKPYERRRLHLFAEDFFTSIEGGLEFPRLSAALPGTVPEGLPGNPPAQTRHVYQPVSPVRPADTHGRRVVILTDALACVQTGARSDARPDLQRGQENLLAMTARLNAAFGGNARVVNLHDIDIKGGCQGCLRCGAAYKCAYTGKDEFIDFYNTVLVPADIIVFAGAIVARQLSWKWREFFDRSFFNTHTPSLVGKQFAFVVAGPLSLLPEFRETYEAWTELQQSNLVTFISDEAGTGVGGPDVLAVALDQLAERLVRLAEAAYIRPHTFLGVAGMKIFRDDIWSELRVVFRADHSSYKRLGFYDFPQRRIGHRVLMGLAWFITGLPGIRSKFPSMIRTQMIVPIHRAAMKDAAQSRGEVMV